MVVVLDKNENDGLQYFYISISLLIGLLVFIALDTEFMLNFLLNLQKYADFIIYKLGLRSSFLEPPIKLTACVPSSDGMQNCPVWNFKRTTVIVICNSTIQEQNSSYMHHQFYYIAVFLLAFLKRITRETCHFIGSSVAVWVVELKWGIGMVKFVHCMRFFCTGLFELRWNSYCLLSLLTFIQHFTLF